MCGVLRNARPQSFDAAFKCSLVESKMGLLSPIFDHPPVQPMSSIVEEVGNAMRIIALPRIPLSGLCP